MVSKAAGVIALLFCATSASAQLNDWSRAYAAAQQLLSGLDLVQIANISLGNSIPGSFEQTTTGDGPNGVTPLGGPPQGEVRGVSGFVSAQTMAMSWDRQFVTKQWTAMANEFKAKGYGNQLGPTTEPLGRSVFGGRLFEGFGSDPYLNGKLFATAVAAVQSQGVIATGKHFLGNEQETNRTDYLFRPIETDRMSANIDDRTTHEVYLWPWVDGVAAGLGSVMCVMTRVNDTQGCQNNHTLNGLLKTELAFPGYVVPDFSAITDNTAAMLAGNDLAGGVDADSIVQSVSNGSIPEAVVRDHAIRIVATQYNINGNLSALPSTTSAFYDDVREISTKDFIRNIGANSITLLKNTNNALPLSKPKIVGVFGKNAANLGAGPTWLEEVESYQGDTYASHLVSGGGSGRAPQPYIVSPLDALTARASTGKGFSINYILANTWQVEAPPAPWWEANISTTIQINAEAADTCLVFINAFAKEGVDRRALSSDEDDQLVIDVAKYCNNTIVVLNTAGARVVEAWIENPNVTAVLYAGLLGEQSGNSIADVLFGDVNPAGHLPYTIARNASDYNGAICPCCECNYTEGLFIDYRYFDQANITPRFEFGFGLSYTTFNYTNPTITMNNSNTQIHAIAGGTQVLGGVSELFETMITASITVTNTGALDGDEVVQLYVAFPEGSDEPVRQLRGFERVTIKSNMSEVVSFDLQRRDLSIWDVVQQKWTLVEGDYTVFFGKSSRHFEGNGTFSLDLSG